MEKTLLRGKGWLGVGLSLVLCLALVASPVAPGAAEGAEGICDSCLSYTIMRPDRETREEWIEAYNNAPRVYIDRAGFQASSSGGSHSLLDHLEYIPGERAQGACENCWAWAGTGVMEIALSVQEGIKDRLSVQYINSCQGDVIGKDCCAGGGLSDFANFYDPLTDGVGQCIPWANDNAYWQSSDGSCGPVCGSISTTPNYPITAIEEQVIPTLPTDGVTDQATAIANIKYVLDQDTAVWFGYFLPTEDAWADFRDFWHYSDESVVYDIDKFCGVPDQDAGGHAVLCVGYNDDDPANSYWVMLNSWGTTPGRPNGLFRINMDMGYQCVNAPYYSFDWQTLDVAFDIPGQPTITVDPIGFDVTLPPDTVHEYIVSIGNTGDVDLTYDISVQETTVGTAVAQEGRLFSAERAGRVLEAPLKGEPVEPEHTGQPQGGWQTIMTDGFEGAFPGDWELWVAPGATDARWGKTSYKSHTGSYSVWCAGSTYSPTSDYPNNMDAWMIYGPFSLEDATAAELNFWFWADTELGYDWLDWMASTDAEDFCGEGFSGYSGGWVEESFDLTDVHTLGNLCGEPEVWIAFRFESDYMITAQGAFIDNVVLRKYVADEVNKPPHTPLNPSPANHATHVSIDADLSWTGGDPDADDTVTYDVHFGTSSPPPFKEDIGPYPATETSLNYELEPLDYNTTYYWKIVATDDQGASTTGPVWEFTTGGPDCTWLDVEPNLGSVAPGGSCDLTVTIDTSGLETGDYSAEIVIANNDPDNDPAIVPVTLHVSDVVPTVTTEAATDVGTDSATLNMSYTLGEYSSVDVRFAYKKAADTDWTETPWVSKSEAGSHVETLSGLDSNTLYDFKAQLEHDTTQIEGAELQFTTGITPPKITTEVLPDGCVGVPYEADIEASGGTEPYTWSWTALEEGQDLPPELDLDAETGIISGIPTEDGTFDFTVRVTDAENATAERDLSIVVEESGYIATFVVTDEDTDPVEGATVNLNHEEALTDADGRAEFEVVSGTYNYTVSKESYVNATGDFEVTDEDVTVLVTLEDDLDLPEATTWNCPLGGMTLIAPNPLAGRPELTSTVACEEITLSEGADLWGIYYLVEDPADPKFGEWLYYIPGFIGSPLTELEPGKYYWVVVSKPCVLTIPQ